MDNEQKLDIAKRILTQTEEVWKPFADMDAEYSRWAEMPLWKKIFIRRPNIVTGHQRFVACENRIVAKIIVDALESGDEKRINSLINDPLFPGN